MNIDMQIKAAEKRIKVLEGMVTKFNDLVATEREDLLAMYRARTLMNNRYRII